MLYDDYMPHRHISPTSERYFLIALSSMIAALHCSLLRNHILFGFLSLRLFRNWGDFHYSSLRIIPHTWKWLPWSAAACYLFTEAALPQYHGFHIVCTMPLIFNSIFNINNTSVLIKWHCLHTSINFITIAVHELYFHAHFTTLWYKT